MANKHMDQIERSFRNVADALKNGKFTRTELEGIKMFAEHVVGATDLIVLQAKILNRINKSKLDVDLCDTMECPCCGEVELRHVGTFVNNEGTTVYECECANCKRMVNL
jgi:hypothetical protein